LLVRRTTPPFTLVPPGGRLLPNEDPHEGVLREVKEETGLAVALCGVAHIWFGNITAEAAPILCVNFLAEAATDEVKLSPEHSESVWVTREDIATGRVATLDQDGRGYRPEDLLEAFDGYQRWATRNATD
jgi:ADP-ribose pyrophosphatase YjhB (NUDIX family)